MRTENDWLKIVNHDLWWFILLDFDELSKKLLKNTRSSDDYLKIMTIIYSFLNANVKFIVFGFIKIFVFLYKNILVFNIIFFN